MRIAYLGPAGTFTEDALADATGDEFEPMRTQTVRDAILAVERGEADRALVPFENSIEGSVRVTLDTLAHETSAVEIVGEHDHAVAPALIAKPGVGLDEVRAVLSHPQPLAQCARFLAGEMPGAEPRETASTADAVRLVSESGEPLAALGSRSAAELYGCAVLRRDVADEAGNVTRFVWIAPSGTAGTGNGAWKTAIVFSELGEDHPGALVDALQVFSERGINLTRIESRPRRNELGRYMFFCDLDGGMEQDPVREAVGQLEGLAESVRVLGSYRLE